MGHALHEIAASPDGEGSSNPTALEQEVLALIPSLRDLQELHWASVADLSESIDVINSKRGVQLTVGTSSTPSPTWLQLVRLNRQLAFSVDSPEAFVDVSVAARLQAHESVRSALGIHIAPSDATKREYTVTAQKDADILFPEKVMIERAQQEFALLDDIGRTELIRLLISSLHEHRDDNNIISTLMVVLASPKNAATASPLELLIEEFEAGEQDSLVYQFAITSESAQHRSTSLRAMTELLVRVSLDKDPDETQDEVVARAARHTTHFTNGSSIELLQIRRDVIRSLVLQLEMMRSSRAIPGLKKDLAVLQRQLALATEVLCYELERHTYSAQQRNVSNKRRTAIASSIAALEAHGLTESVDAPSVPRRLMLAQASEGSFVTPTHQNGQLEAALTEYLRRFQGANKLEENMRSALQYIKDADFSAGRVRGISPHGDNLVLDGRPSRIFALKPQDAPGVPINSDAMRNTRIMFMLNEDGDAVIVSFMKRDERRRFEDAVGIGRSRRK